MGAAGSLNVTRLKKVHVEALLSDFDSDPVGALTRALRVTLDKPDDEWLALLSRAPLSPIRRDRLRAAEQAALDELAAELNEQRQLAR
jgi:hypothetical protein